MREQIVVHHATENDISRHDVDDSDLDLFDAWVRDLRRSNRPIYDWPAYRAGKRSETRAAGASGASAVLEAMLS